MFGQRGECPRQLGFTLIELMVVVVVLAIMAGLVLPRFLSQAYDAKISAAKTNMKTLQTALEQYYIHMDAYPTMDQGLAGVMDRPQEGGEMWHGPYLTEMPVDPWGNEFQYRIPGEGSHAYELWSRGADGKDGGEEKASDISLWRETEKD